MARAKCYNTLDAYCRLIALLVRHSGDASNNVTKINLLSRVSIILSSSLVHKGTQTVHDVEQNTSLRYHKVRFIFAKCDFHTHILTLRL